jgi:serine/threonine protein kinase
MQGCDGENRHGDGNSQGHGGGGVTGALREAAILAELRHPNTVLFYGVAIKKVSTAGMSATAARFTKPDSYYYVTELCDTALNRVPLGVGQVEGSELWQVLVQVAAGMQYLHSKGIMHRDLKPGNVLVSEVRRMTTATTTATTTVAVAAAAGATAAAATPAEASPAVGPWAAVAAGTNGATAGTRRMVCQAHKTYKICDFGMSRILGVSDGAWAKRERAITGGIGTALWMAPEVITTDRAQLNAHPFGGDVYAFGILAWEVLAGERPYVGLRHGRCRGIGAHQIKQLVVGGLRCARQRILLVAVEPCIRTGSYWMAVVHKATSSFKSANVLCTVLCFIVLRVCL